MLKKWLATTVVLAVSSTMACASGVPYVGFGTGVKTNTSSHSGNARVMPGSVFAGYGMKMAPNVYLGGELFGDVGSMVVNSNGLKSTYGLGASVMPGLMFNEHTLGFVRAGVVRTRFTSLDASSTGGQVGLGLQTDLSQCWSIRSEYDYTAYNKVKGVNAKSDEFKVGFVYKLG